MEEATSISILDRTDKIIDVTILVNMHHQGLSQHHSVENDCLISHFSESWPQLLCWKREHGFNWTHLKSFQNQCGPTTSP